jgi:hypothetical protein
MAFTVKGSNGIDDATARQRVQASFAYLKRSPLAKSILEDLENNAEVCIEVDPTAEPFFAHPESSYATITSGGTAVWNPTMSLPTFDSERWRGHDGGSYDFDKRKRVDAPWVPQHTERATVQIEKRGLSLKIARALKLSPTRSVRRNVPAKKNGTLSTHMCLMHELGHALQYATYPTHFLHIKNTFNSAHAQESLEETNLMCVEIPIALELRALGEDETPRWVYGHSR